DAVFAGEEDVLAALPDDRADEALILPQLVGGSAIQVGHAPIEGLEQGRPALPVITRAVPAHQSHAPETDGGNPRTAAAQRSRLHSGHSGMLSCGAASTSSCKHMIIDCHGHYTTAPAELTKFRDAQVAALKSS